jgi:hypothetical protein
MLKHENSCIGYICCDMCYHDYIHMQRHKQMCFFMSILYSKIKFEIDINDDELLETIWEHMKEI